MPEHQGCWSAQVRTVVPEARRALEEGCAVVIGLQSTGEAAADSLGLEPGQSCGSVSTTKQMLRHFVAMHFPLRRETQKNGEGWAKSAHMHPPHATDSRQKAARWGWNEVAVFVIICQGMLVW